MMNDARRFFSGRKADLAGIAGKWYIQKTSLAFWENRFSPTVTYTPEANSPAMKMLDEVRYKNKRGVVKEVVGYDYLTSNINGQFMWRAKPWYLYFLKSEWGIVDHDEAYTDWAVTYFSKTAFTPEGMDIYSRSEVLDDDKYKEILQRIAGVGFLKPHLDKLYQTK